MGKPMSSGNGLVHGYSLLEIAFITLLIALVGIFAVTKYMELSTSSKESVEAGVLEGIQEGISSYANKYRDQRSGQIYPSFLDSADIGAATPQNLFFENVLDRGIAVSGWSKTGLNKYRAPSGKVYTYDPGSGIFETQFKTGSQSLEK